ncbi:hypothetical protein MMMIC1C10_18380 [Methanococcus maripaludis]
MKKKNKKKKKKKNNKYEKGEENHTEAMTLEEKKNQECGYEYMHMKQHMCCM